MFQVQSKIVKGLLFVSVILCLVTTKTDVFAASQSSSDVKTIRVSANSGNDTDSCGGEAEPCRTLNYAVFNRSAVGDDVTILVAAGTYRRTESPCNRSAVVCVQSRTVTLLGGYADGNWQTSDPVTNQTVIDGESAYMGVYLQGFDVDRVNPSVHFKMSGFTVQNGWAQGASSGSEVDVTAFGAGLFADFAYVELSNLNFQNNQVQGGSTAQDAGGASAGGGIALRGSGTTEKRSLLDNITFTDNRSRGGDGAVRGGIAFGGGLYIVDSAILGSSLRFQSNSAIAGNSVGNGVFQGEDAGSQGGAISVQIGSDAIFENITAVDNLSQGGDAAFDGGGGGGGAILAELATLTVRNSILRDNIAKGASGAEGGLGAGGALFGINSNITLDRVSMINNKAIGGPGSSKVGAAGGGAAYIAHFRDSYSFVVNNSVIANNYIEQGTGGSPVGGGGGALWLQGVNAQVSHSTFVGNSVGPGLGAPAVIAFGLGTSQATNVSLLYNIFADHSQDVALALIAPASMTLTRNLFANNNQDVGAGIAGNETSLTALSVGFMAPSAPNYDFHIDPSSPAVDQATGSSEQIDRDGESRVDVPDIGAYEASLSFGPDNFVYLPVITR